MPNLAPMMAADDDIQQPAKPTFKIFSSALKAYEREVDGTTRKMLKCTASSTVKDLHGDYMTDECVQGMAPQAKSKAMTIFLNHSYKWPEDIFGKTTDAKVVARSGPDATTVWDLDLEIELNEGNQRAIDTYAAIKDQGIKAGVSIGAMIEDYAFIDEEEGFWGGLEIKQVDLLEASIVGIPANQRSWVVNALAALDAPKGVINKALGRTKESNPPKLAPEPPAPEPPASPAVMQLEAKIASQRFILDGVDITDKVTVEIVEKDAELNEDGSVTLENAPASPDPETPDGGDPSDDADTTASAADAVDALKSLKGDESLTEIVLSFLEGATVEVASLRKSNAELTKERDEARQEVQSALEIVETIAKTPLGRKAQFSGPVSTFRSRFSGYYSESLLRLLDEREDEPE